MKASPCSSARWRALACVAFLLTCVGVARAQRTELPTSLVQSALAAHKATANAPSELDAQDFAIERLVEQDASDGAAEATSTHAPVEVQARLQAGSLRWVRVAPVTLVARGVLHVRVAGARRGDVAYAGFTHPLVASDDGDLHAELPVALLSDAAQPIVVRVAHSGGAVQEARYAVRFVPRQAQRGLVMFDASCSPWGLRVARGAIPSDSFLYLGCRVVRTARADDVAATLELYALWDNALGASEGPRAAQSVQSVQVDGLDVQPAVGALYTLRVGAKPGHVHLAARGQGVTLAYALPDTLPAAFVGAGIGPYRYDLRDGDREASTVVPLVTVYGGYTFTPDVRLVFFNATALHRRGYADNGLYLWLEQARGMDERLSFNLLLGGNLLVYSQRDTAQWRFTAPQGFELIYRDIFGRNRSATLGAFLYPEIFESSYYNVWLRWGSPQLFGELNYIHWKQPRAGGATSSTSVGVSFGTPIARFF